MCNYSVTPGCASPIPVPSPQCVSARPVPTTSAHTHTLLATPARSNSTILNVPVVGFQVVRITEACWERDSEPDFSVDLCQQGFLPVMEVLEYHGLLKDKKEKSGTLTNVLMKLGHFTDGFH